MNIVDYYSYKKDTFGQYTMDSLGQPLQEIIRGKIYESVEYDGKNYYLVGDFSPNAVPTKFNIVELEDGRYVSIDPFYDEDSYDIFIALISEFRSRTTLSSFDVDNFVESIDSYDYNIETVQIKIDDTKAYILELNNNIVSINERVTFLNDELRTYRLKLQEAQSNGMVDAISYYNGKIIEITNEIAQLNAEIVEVTDKINESNVKLPLYEEAKEKIKKKIKQYYDRFVEANTNRGYLRMMLTEVYDNFFNIKALENKYKYMSSRLQAYKIEREKINKSIQDITSIDESLRTSTQKQQLTFLDERLTDIDRKIADLENEYDFDKEHDKIIFIKQGRDDELGEHIEALSGKASKNSDGSVRSYGDAMTQFEYETEKRKMLDAISSNRKRSIDELLNYFGDLTKIIDIRDDSYISVSAVHYHMRSIFERKIREFNKMIEIENSHYDEKTSEKNSKIMKDLITTIRESSVAATPEEHLDIFKEKVSIALDILEVNGGYNKAKKKDKVYELFVLCELYYRVIDEVIRIRDANLNRSKDKKIDFSLEFKKLIESISTDTLAFSERLKRIFDSQGLDAVRLEMLTEQSRREESRADRTSLPEIAEDFENESKLSHRIGTSIQQSGIFRAIANSKFVTQGKLFEHIREKKKKRREKAERREEMLDAISNMEKYKRSHDVGGNIGGYGR